MSGSPTQIDCSVVDSDNNYKDIYTYILYIHPKLGNESYCSWSGKGKGRFRGGNEGAAKEQEGAARV